MTDETPALPHDDHQLVIAVGKRNMGKAETKTVPWSRLCGMLADPFKTKETVAEYQAMGQVERNAIKARRGWWIAADLPDGTRRRTTVGVRSCIACDIDDATAAQYTLFRAGRNPASRFEFFAHQTHSHTPASPRWRVVFPLKKPIPNAHYEAASRLLARLIDPSMGMVDHVTFRKIQMMFRPTYSADAKPDPWRNQGELLDVYRDLLDEFEGDWEDFAQLPRRPQEKATREAAAKAQDPTTKTGIVGAFCRTYDVEQAIEQFLPDIYGHRTELGDKPRYTYLLGTGSNAVEVEDEGLFIYSHHGSDPCSEQLCNAFDMVRIHLFGHLDGDRATVDEGGEPLSPAKWPSYRAMVEMLEDDADVMSEGSLMAEEDFSEDDVGEPDDEPAPAPTPRKERPKPAARAVDPDIADLIGDGPEEDLIGTGPAPQAEMDDDIAALIGRPGEAPSPKKPKKLTPIERLNQKHAFVKIGGSSRILNIEPGGGITISQLSDFHSQYANDPIPDTRPNKNGTWPSSVAWMESRKRRQYTGGVVFDPSAPLSKPTDRGEDLVYNLWNGWTVVPRRDTSCELFLAHCRDVICNGDEALYVYLLGWMAHIVQQPGDKPGVALVLRGRKGVGKDTVGDYLGRICHQNHVKISQMNQLTGQFNAHMEKALILHVEEAIWAGDKAKHGPLQQAITGEFMSIERKGVDIVQRPNFMRLIISSNEDWVIPATEDERRYFVLDVPDTRKDDHAYFAALRHERDHGGAEALLAFLQDYDLSDFVVRNVPKTAGLAAQIQAGAKNVDAFVRDFLDTDATLPAHTHPDFFDLDWREDAVPVLKAELYEFYLDWMKDRQRYGHGAPLSKERFGMRFRALVHSTPAQRGHPRITVHLVPRLPWARENYEATMGAGVPWTPTEDDDDGTGALV
jgi:hypothetical protein